MASLGVPVGGATCQLFLRTALGLVWGWSGSYTVADWHISSSMVYCSLRIIQCWGLGISLSFVFLVMFTWVHIFIVNQRRLWEKGRFGTLNLQVYTPDRTGQFSSCFFDLWCAKWVCYWLRLGGRRMVSMYRLLRQRWFSVKHRA